MEGIKEVLKWTFYTSVVLKFFHWIHFFSSLNHQINKIDTFLEKYNKKGREIENIKQNEYT